jgi:putative endonuclease
MPSGLALEVVDVRAKDVLGRAGEDAAARHLSELGYVVLDRNWRCPLGEIDIVASDGTSLVVCEVKTRGGRAHGSPAEAVTYEKLARLRLLAIEWVKASSGRWPRVRIDVIAVVRSGGRLQCDHRVGVG